MNTQHVCFGLVVGPKSEMGFVKEILGWAKVALGEAMWKLWMRLEAGGGNVGVGSYRPGPCSTWCRVPCSCF